MLLMYEWRKITTESVAFQPRFLTVSQAADLLEVSEATMWLWIESGEVPSELLPSGRRQISRAVLLACLRQNSDLASESARLESTLRM